MKQVWLPLLGGIVGSIVTLIFVMAYWPSLSPPPPVASVDLNPRFVNVSPGNAPAVPTFDFREAARRATPAVVHISNIGNSASGRFRFFFDEEEDGSIMPEGAGSGVIYSSDGYIITNNHVVEGASRLEVTLHDNRKLEARVIGTDEKSDLAVIKIEAGGLPTLEIADSDKAEIGEWVLAVGNPLELTGTVTAGIISAKGRSLQLLPDRDAIEAFIQTDAAVNPGNSGGALVDAQGRLLGINTAIATRTGLFQGYSFAIPVNLVTRIADDLIEFGAYQRTFLGVSIYPLNTSAAERLRVNISQGVVIDELVPGGAAQRAGLRADDIIIRVNGYLIRNVPELTEIVGRSRDGDVLTVTVVRQGNQMEIPVRMRAQVD